MPMIPVFDLELRLLCYTSVCLTVYVCEDDLVQKVPNAAAFLARLNGETCEGPEECHWCTSPCDRKNPHDDPYPIPFVKTLSSAKRPGNSYVCKGCMIYRRPKVTINYLNGGFKDGRCLLHQSWWMDESGIYVLGKDDYQALYQKLLNPPHQFVLSLIEEQFKVKNNIEDSVVNFNQPVAANTKLWYTLNNVRFSFEVYELGEAVKYGVEGKMAGVRELVRYLGPMEYETEERKRGRPPKKDDSPRRIVTS